MNYRTDVSKIDIFSALMATYFVFINSFSFFLAKKLTLKIDSAALSGGQVKLTYFMYFPWPPLEAGLSI
jgi:hypothetical protein